MGAVWGWFRFGLFQAGLDWNCFRVQEMGWFRWELFWGGLNGSCFRVRETGRLGVTLYSA